MQWIKTHPWGVAVILLGAYLGLWGMYYGGLPSHPVQITDEWIITPPTGAYRVLSDIILWVAIVVAARQFVKEELRWHKKHELSAFLYSMFAEAMLVIVVTAVVMCCCSLFIALSVLCGLLLGVLQGDISKNRSDEAACLFTTIAVGYAISSGPAMGVAFLIIWGAAYALSFWLSHEVKELYRQSHHQGG